MKILILVMLLIAVFRVLFSTTTPYEGKEVKLTGLLTTEPREYGTSYLISLHDFSFFVPRDSAIAFGSTISVQGKAKGHELSDVKVISVKKPTSFLAKVRERILLTIKKTLPEPESSLIAGATIGAPNIPTVFNEALRATGTSHIVVASGGNLAILGGFLEATFSRVLKRRIFLPLIALILIIYSALTGFGAPIVRALIMWLTLITAQLYGRAVRTFIILILTVLLMIIIKPIWLNDVSFQLSAGATFGIVCLAPFIQQKIKRVPVISESFSTSLAAQVGILPVSIFVFQKVQVLAPFWNVLVLWTVPYLTVIGLLGSVVSLVVEPLGQLVFLSAYPFAWYFVRIISLV